MAYETQASPTDDEVLKYFDTLSNWGRWGVDDQLGALNFITAEVRRAAAAEISEGTSFSCANLIAMNNHRVNDNFTNIRLMQISGEGLTEERMKRTGRVWTAAEWIGMQFHGHNITHIDAPSHGSFDRKMYNGFDAHRVNVSRGATKLATPLASGRIATRGVLLDIPAVRGVDWLREGDGVFPADLEAAEQRQGVQVREGDFALLYTGSSKRRRTEGIWDYEHVGQPGWDAACLPWLHERGVCAIGADTANDIRPLRSTVISHPVHAVGLVAMGLWLLDNADFTDLAAECARVERWSFFFSIGMIPIQGGTGAPVDPIAVF
jgi:kynurenine formamidase